MRIRHFGKLVPTRLFLTEIYFQEVTYHSFGINKLMICKSQTVWHICTYLLYIDIMSKNPISLITNAKGSKALILRSIGVFND